ncbi:hypothetical protein DESHY_20006 [Desulforamulus hydrothermalis Lam5 = DSM 18033]|uniref:Uncharacterized protein n=1 Tax=Desulforamulus hydrothermalis Lam5 = DSM 18033 TaxID=1121428 RepID=K8DYU8_9FIRM|nr:hypothetical protein DESHY_20006 [Desulforamulus hydrothermalis Lam5 = DSM 18033]SHH48903.1 hypothetical protein SAMN02745177_02692 [Desulforamulus hydrothermalis Lam5 = DSM 18033]
MIVRQVGTKEIQEVTMALKTEVMNLLGAAMTLVEVFTMQVKVATTQVTAVDIIPVAEVTGGHLKIPTLLLTGQ